MLVASGLAKHYDGVAALSGAGLTLAAGEVHGLVGENGAGKSTLVKIISGVVRPDAGGIRLDGRAVEFHDARDAAAHGVAVVSQELATFGDLSVLENLFPYGGPRRFGLVSARLMASQAAPVLASLGLDLPLRARAGDLALAERQLLEIARALLHRPRVMILDEPTSALPRDAAARLAGVLRRLTANGLAVLYISHFLEEVMSVADRVTVLRDGHVVLPAVRTGEVDLGTLVHAMLGDAPPAATHPEPGHPEPGGTGTGRTGTAVAAHRGRAAAVPLVELAGVEVTGRVSGLSLAVGGGEIVGLAGLQGAGHRAALDLVCGRTRPASGTVRLPGGRVPGNPRQALAAGVAYVSGDRRGRGLMPDKSLWENVTQVSWLGLGRGGMLPRRAGLIATATHYLREVGVRGAGLSQDEAGARGGGPGQAGTRARGGGPYQRAGALSGGNQQKLVLAKWLAAAPEVLVLDDPTRGVDVGARAELHDLVRGLAEAGRAVLVTSTDLAEIVELCDRVLVFQHGRVVATLSGERLTEHDLSLAMNAGFTATS